MVPHQNIREFLKALPPNLMSLILYDNTSQIIGFAISDTDNDQAPTKIYDTDCKQVTTVPLHTTVKEIVNTLIKHKCPYIA